MHIQDGQACPVYAAKRCMKKRETMIVDERGQSSSALQLEPPEAPSLPQTSQQTRQDLLRIDLRTSSQK